MYLKHNYRRYGNFLFASQPSHLHYKMQIFALMWTLHMQNGGHFVSVPHCVENRQWYHDIFNLTLNSRCCVVISYNSHSTSGHQVEHVYWWFSVWWCWPIPTIPWVRFTRFMQYYKLYWSHLGMFNNGYLNRKPVQWLDEIFCKLCLWASTT